MDKSVRPEVRVLGPLTITGSENGRGTGRASALELIAYLALHPQGAGRDEILEALWPEVDPKRSRQRLYQATRVARRLLSDGFQHQRDRYQLDTNLVRVDTTELETLLAQADHTSDPMERIRLLEAALALFRGEPLSGADYSWAEGALRRLRGTHTALLETTATASLQAGDARRALNLAEHALAIDHLNESFWRLALEAESQLGLRDAITSRYRQLQQTLDEQLGLQPSQQTRTLYRTLLSQA